MKSAAEYGIIYAMKHAVDFDLVCGAFFSWERMLCYSPSLQAKCLHFLFPFSATASGTLIGLFSTLLVIYRTFTSYCWIDITVGLVGFVFYPVIAYSLAQKILVVRHNCVYIRSSNNVKGT